MSWTLVSDKYYSDPKFMSLSHGANTLYWVVASWVADQQTNGYIRTRDLHGLARMWRVKTSAIDELCATPEGFDQPFLVEEHDGLFRIHEDDRFRRKSSAERMRRFRHRRRESDGESDEGDASHVTPVTRHSDVTKSHGDGPPRDPARGPRALGSHSHSHSHSQTGTTDLSIPSRPLSPFAEQVAVVVEEVSGRPPSGQGIDFLERVQAEAPRLSADALAEKYRQTSAHFQELGKQAPAITYLKLWCREENARLADQGVPAPRRESNGFVGVGRVLGATAQPSSPAPTPAREPERDRDE